jgi:hypothetical protein
LGDVDLSFSPILVRNGNTIGRKLNEPQDIVPMQSIHTHGC